MACVCAPVLGSTKCKESLTIWWTNLMSRWIFCYARHSSEWIWEPSLTTASLIDSGVSAFCCRTICMYPYEGVFEVSNRPNTHTSKRGHTSFMLRFFEKTLSSIWTTYPPPQALQDCFQRDFLTILINCKHSRVINTLNFFLGSKGLNEFIPRKTLLYKISILFATN